mmetsp:Transcript_30338/g.56874  ORF Transcript_30338/g.56874 Transcript_30338/m.56874 type:complete len:332 (-) Transcript_30338:42-1037(-)
MILSTSLLPRSFEVGSMSGIANITLTSTETSQLDGYRDMFQSAAISTGAWLLLFYALSATYPCWSKQVSPSSKEHENNRYWCARDVIGIIHALVVCSLSLPPLFMLLLENTHVQYASTNHLATCKVNYQKDPDLVSWEATMEAVALAGLIFTTFTLADLLVLCVHGLATVDYVIHHVAFVVAGAIIRCNCILPLNAVILMAMEVSTPFLNWVMIFRHRGERYKLQVIVAGTLFFFTFIVFRLFLNIYGTVFLLVGEAQGSALPAHVPAWQAAIILVAVAAGAGVQLFWLPKIWRTFGTRIWQLLMTGSVNTGDEEEDSRLTGSGPESSSEK